MAQPAIHDRNSGLLMPGDENVPGSTPTEGLDYARRLYVLILDWYKSADQKAQVLLTLDGVFLAFITGSVFVKQDDLVGMLERFTTYTWLFLAAMCLSLLASVASALACLWSRMHLLPSTREKTLRDLEARSTGDKDAWTFIYPPQVMGFFQHIGWLEEDRFRRSLERVDQGFELRVLANQISTVSRNVTKKHLRVDVGFLCAGSSLVFFLASGVSYLLASLA